MPKESNLPPVLLGSDSSSCTGPGFIPGVVVGALIATFASCCGVAAVYLCQRYKRRRARSSGGSHELNRSDAHLAISRSAPSRPPRPSETFTHGKNESSEDNTVAPCDLESNSHQAKKESPSRVVISLPTELHPRPRPPSQASVATTHDSSHAFYASEFDPPLSAFSNRRFSVASTVSLAGARRTSVELSNPPSPRETSPFSPTSPRTGIFAHMQQSHRSSPLRPLRRPPSTSSALHVLPSRASSFNSHKSGRMSSGSLPRLNTPMGHRSATIDEIPPLPKSPMFSPS